MAEFSVAILCLAGWVFAASAAMKLRSRWAYSSFRDGLRETGLVPGRLLPSIAAVLCWVEVAVAAGLLGAAALTAVAVSGAVPFAESVLGVAAGLTGVLAVGVAVVIRRGAHARCVCFGAGSSRPLGRAHLARNLSLMAVVCAGLGATDDAVAWHQDAYAERDEAMTILAVDPLLDNLRADRRIRARRTNEAVGIV